MKTKSIWIFAALAFAEILMFQNCAPGFQAGASGATELGNSAPADSSITPVPTSTPVAAPTATPRPTATPAATPLPTATPPGNATPHPNPTPVSSATPVPTPAATATPVSAPTQACYFGTRTIAEGASVTAYQNFISVSGENCVSEIRNCKSNQLSGSFGYSQCTTASDVLGVNAASWIRYVSLGVESPAAFEPGDINKTWVSPDGRTITDTVKGPHPLATAATVTLASVPDGADARPYFDAAVAQVKATHAGKLVVPKGTYVFQTTGKLSTGTIGHLLLFGLTDVTIEGNGSTLMFTQNQVGVLMRSNTRVKMQNFYVDSSMRNSSYGTIQLVNGQKVLVIDPKFPVTAADGLAQLKEFNLTNKTWVSLGERVLFPTPNSTFIGNQTYSSTDFKNLTVGKVFSVSHHWYGGVAIEIADFRSLAGYPPSEDVWLDHVTIYSGPGMGIVPYGIKRGFALTNSAIQPRPDGISIMSVEWDGMNSPIIGGDTILMGNKILDQGDDGINVGNPDSEISAISNNGMTMQLATYSRFMAIGDQVAFFSNAGKYLGNAKIVGGPRLISSLVYEIDIDQVIPNVAVKGLARDMEIVNKRIYIDNNELKRGGMLAQAANTLIEGNNIHDTASKGIRAIANVGSFKEGTGAVNVIIQNNVLTNIGGDNSQPIGFGAISVYGAAVNAITAEVVNGNMTIANNLINGSLQGCITIASTAGAVLTNNTCTNTNQIVPKQGSIVILKSANISCSGNSRSGASTTGVSIDTATTSGINCPAY